jgi:hypothetical protein
MPTIPSEAVRLFGTEEIPQSPVLLAAGGLTAELENGNLRYIRWNGIELLRAVSYIVRDRNWGTYNPEISNLAVEQGKEGFRVVYEAVARDAKQTFRYSAEITGASDGTLVFHGRGHAVGDFLTNRTGFVVLHPVERVAGFPAMVEHVDGKTVETKFPEIIDPLQPMMDLRAITHEPHPGVGVTCRMEGDTFEMEDQRNWMDASYKTYVRPLGLPWPYTLKDGETLDQTVTVTVNAAERGAASPTAGGATLSLSGEGGTIPPLGFGLEPELAERTLAAVSLLKAAAPHHVLVHYDARRGARETILEAGAKVAIGVGAEPWLELVVSDLDNFAAEIAGVGAAAAALGSPFATVLVSPAPDLKSTLPGSVWPACPPLAEVYVATRRAFPSARLGGGMFSYFTELNRKRPPLDEIDLVTFTNSSVVHAGDDRSVTEGLETLPYIARSAAAIAGGKPWHAGPSALGMRANPYGDAPMANPGNIRQAMNRMDPRQRGLLGGAWYVGYCAHLVRGGANAVTVGGGVGEFGIAHAAMHYAQPFFDAAGGVYPAFHVFKGLSALGGAKAIAVDVAPAREVQGVVAKVRGTTEAWIANLTGVPRDVSLHGWPGAGSVFVLDKETFVPASKDPDAVENLSRSFTGTTLALDAYAVARLRSHL